MKQTLEISRTRVLLRARYGWPRKTVEYHVRQHHQPDNYRMDASGYVSMCYDIPISAAHWGGANVISLLTDGFMEEIPIADLQPGDALGYLGRDAMDSDGGAIVIFDKWLANNPANQMALTWAHLPVIGLGPDQRALPVSYKWHAYRFKHIVTESAPVAVSA